MDIQVRNPEPMHIVINDMLDPGFAEELIDVLKLYGTDVTYSGCEGCKELRLDYYGKKAPVAVGHFASKEEINVTAALHRAIYPLQDLISRTFTNTACDFITGHNGFWLMEYKVGAHFNEHIDYSTDEDGYSTKAVYTLCISLNDDYEGGELFISGTEMNPPVYGGLIWDGWTNHEVKKVTKGERYVLVIHFLGQLKD